MQTTKEGRRRPSALWLQLDDDGGRPLGSTKACSKDNDKRAWAEDEAKRAREQAKVLEEARDRWERHGIKVVVDSDLREDENVGITWLEAGKQISVEGTVSRAENLVNKLKANDC